MYIIENITNGEKGKFFYRENKQTLAEMTYIINFDKKEMTIDHTFVDEVLKGKGIGSLMVEKGIIFARENGYKIVPLCPFVATLIGRKPEWQDVV